MTNTTTNRAGVVKLWLLNLVANAAVLATAYFWLLIPDARGWQVAGSAILAIIVVVLVLWLRAGTLAYFRVTEFRKDGAVWRAYRHGLRQVPALAIWVLVFLVLAWLLWSLDPYVPQFAVWFRQKLGGGPSPRNIMADANWLLLVVGRNRDAWALAAYRDDGFRSRIQTRARRPIPTRLETASLLVVVLPAARVRNLSSIQARLVDSRSAIHPAAGMEYESALPCGIPYRCHCVSSGGLDDCLAY